MAYTIETFTSFDTAKAADLKNLHDGQWTSILDPGALVAGWAGSGQALHQPTDLYYVNGTLTSDGMLCRVRWRPNALPNNPGDNPGIVLFFFSGGAGVTLALTEASLLTVARGYNFGVGGASWLQTGTATIVADGSTWYDLELAVKCHDATGMFEVRVDGEAVQALTQANVDTQDGVNPVFDSCGVGNALDVNYSLNADYDDFVLTVGTGAFVNGDFLTSTAVGAERGPFIATMFPLVQGLYAQFANVTGTGSHHLEVDEPILDDDTSYLNDPDGAKRESFIFGPTPAGTTSIVAVKVNNWVKGVWNNTGANFLRIAGVNYDSAQGGVANFGSTFYAERSVIWTTNPATAAIWTVGGVNNLETGLLTPDLSGALYERLSCSNYELLFWATAQLPPYPPVVIVPITATTRLALHGSVPRWEAEQGRTPEFSAQVTSPARMAAMEGKMPEVNAGKGNVARFDLLRGMTPRG